MTAAAATRLDRNADRRITAGGIVAAGGFVAAALASLALPEATRLGAWLPLHLAAGGAGAADAAGLSVHPGGARGRVGLPGELPGASTAGAVLVAASVATSLALAAAALAGIRQVAAAARG